jgi:hypothetical protein
LYRRLPKINQLRQVVGKASARFHTPLFRRFSGQNARQRAFRQEPGARGAACDNASYKAPLITVSTDFDTPYGDDQSAERLPELTRGTAADHRAAAPDGFDD